MASAGGSKRRNSGGLPQPASKRRSRGSSSDKGGSSEEEVEVEPGGMLTGVHALLVEDGVNLKRLKVWRQRMRQKGATVATAGSELAPAVTHILASDTNRLLRHFSKKQLEDSEGVSVRFEWVEDCLRTGTLLPPREFRLLGAPSRTPSPEPRASLSPKSSPRGASSETPPRREYPPPEDILEDVKMPRTPATRRESVSPFSGHPGPPESDPVLGTPGGGGEIVPRRNLPKEHVSEEFLPEEEKEEYVTEEEKGVLTGVHKGAEVGGVLTANTAGPVEHKGEKGDEKPEEEQGTKMIVEEPEEEEEDGKLIDMRKELKLTGEYIGSELNRHILAPLEELKNIYGNALGDDRRSFSYYKAISAVEHLPFRVTKAEQLKGIPHIGRSLYDHIKELLHTGRIQRLENMKTDPMVRVVYDFSNVWGIGPATAKKLYEMGHRTLKDLESEPSLTPAQKLGLRYNDDINTRIKRGDVATMEDIVRKAANEIVPGIWVVCGGSYRRGKATVGDMDMVITHPDGKSQVGLLLRLIDKLKDQAFLTEDLFVGAMHSVQGTDHEVDTYFGLCKFPGRELRHRIDFKVYPYDQYPFGLIAWTGNDVLNRKLRLIAADKGYHLSDHGLYPAVYRQGDRVHEVSHSAVSVPCKTERDVFNALGVKYIEPQKRNL